jgi:ABC-type lipoprotein export system ATPase subunit
MKTRKTTLNKIIISGPSGCGKSTLIEILEGAMESRGYNEYRVEFVEKLTLGQRKASPTIRFTHPLGMMDFVNLLCKCAGKEVGTLDESPKNKRTFRLKLALAFQDSKKSK